MKVNGDLPIPRETIQKILDSPIPWEGDDAIEEQSKSLLTKLTDEEIEIAAQTSYAYWLATLSEQPPTEEEKKKSALREIRRTLFKNEFEKALEMVQSTMKVRIEHRIDLIRSCFMENIEYDTEEDKALAAKIRSMVEEDMPRQICLARGQDKEGHQILTVFSRTKKGNSDEAYVYLILYSMERSLAVNEFLSMGTKEKQMVVFDLGSFKSSVAASWAANKQVAMMLQHHYPERLKRLVILDPPFWIRTAYNLISPFLDPLTKAKFRACSGDRQKRKAISDVVDPEQAMPFMLPDGKLVGEISVEHYLKGIPFHLQYSNK